MRLKVEELQEVQRLADKVELTAAVKEVCKEFRNYLKAQEIYVSDRRWRKLVKLMKVSAFTSGSEQTTVYDAWVLPHGLWERPEQFDGLQKQYERLITVDGRTAPSRLLQVLKAWEIKLEDEKTTHKKNDKEELLYFDLNGKETTDKSSGRQAKDQNGRLLYKDYHNRKTTDNWDNEPWIEMVDHKPVINQRKFSNAHIESRVTSAQEIISNIERFLSSINDELKTVEIYFTNHLWLDSSLMPEVVDSLEKSKKEAEKLLERANLLAQGLLLLSK